MLAREEIDLLLRLQSGAYELLMWLADEASRDPGVLSPEVTASLQEPETAARWLKRQRDRLPARLLPAEEPETFASLLSSFFSTSFHVHHLEFEGRLLESRVTVGARDTSTAGVEQCQALALQHLASAEKLPLSDKEARTLVRRKSLRDASLLWTYAWELERRARQKGKGPVVHRLWRSLPKEKRKSLTGTQVWDAREQLLAAVRELHNSRRTNA